MINERFFVTNKILYMREENGDTRAIELLINDCEWYPIIKTWEYYPGFWCVKTNCMLTTPALLDYDGNVIFDFGEDFNMLGEGIVGCEKLVGTYTIGCVVSTYAGSVYAESVRAPMIGGGVPQGIERVGLFDLKTKKWLMKPEESKYRDIYKFKNGFARTRYYNFDVRTKKHSILQGWIRRSGEIFKEGYKYVDNFDEDGEAFFIKADGTNGIINIIKGNEKTFKHSYKNASGLKFHEWNGKLCSFAIYDYRPGDNPWEEHPLMIIDFDENVLYTHEDDGRSWIIWDKEQGFMLEYQPKSRDCVWIEGKGYVKIQKKPILTKIVI